LGQDKVVNAALPSDDITVTVTVADVQALIALAGCNN
jgi:hypothetical protein